MPRLPKPLASREQPGHDQLAREYDAYLAHFAAGDHGQVELGAGDQRPDVREQLQAAARRRGLQLLFRRGRGPLTFRIEQLPPEAYAAAQRPAAQAELPADPPLPAVPAESAQLADLPAVPEDSPAQRPAIAAPIRPRRARVQPPAPPAARPAPPAAPRPAREAPRPPARANQRRNAEQRRPNDERRPASGRYDDVLPRWMREGERPAGQQPGRRRNDGKRRTRS